MFGAKFFEKFTTNGDLGLAGSRMVTSADEAGGGRSVAEKAKALPAPNEYWYEILQTTPSGTTQIKTFPIEMLIKIEDND